MKKAFLVLFLLISAINLAYSQSIPSVNVMQFEAGTGASNADAANLTSRTIEELRSWGTLNVTDSGAAFTIRGILSRQGGAFILSGSTLDVNGRVLNEYTERAQTLSAISVLQFCTSAVERVPLPNYLLGTWQSTLNMPDGPVVCIIEFRTDRTVRIERYDTWEHRQNNSLRYEGFGTGIYTYTGFANRIVTANNRQIRIDAITSINLTLEETLPDQTSVNLSNLQILFNDGRTSFEILNNMLPCGRNYDGPSVYPSELIGFTQFRKL
ncbi:MAG: hypothetical protein LBC80_10435 [Treponema sp.]|jgi:hypothetical protein|nr:hypothetical protein [Treponema sp.]